MYPILIVVIGTGIGTAMLIVDLIARVRKMHAPCRICHARAQAIGAVADSLAGFLSVNPRQQGVVLSPKYLRRIVDRLRAEI